MLENYMGDFASLHELYEKKKFGREPLTEKESNTVNRLRYSRVLRKAIDPSIPFGILDLDEYVPGQLELELTYFAVSGRRPYEGATMKHMIDIVGTALEYASSMESLYQQYA